MSDRLTEEQEASLHSMITAAMSSTIRVEGLQLPWENPVFKAIFSTEEVAVPDAVMPVFDQPTEDLRPSIPSASAGPRMMINAKCCVH